MWQRHVSPTQIEVLAYPKTVIEDTHLLQGCAHADRACTASSGVSSWLAAYSTSWTPAPFLSTGAPPDKTGSSKTFDQIFPQYGQAHWFWQPIHDLNRCSKRRNHWNPSGVGCCSLLCSHVTDSEDTGTRKRYGSRQRCRGGGPGEVSGIDPALYFAARRGS